MTFRGPVGLNGQETTTAGQRLERFDRPEDRPMTQAQSHTLDVPGAVLTYDVRRAEGSTEPPLILIGSPMGAGGFATLAGFFTDRTVVTYDPRGVERSPKADDLSESTPEQHADDVHRVIAAVGGGPVDLFASSGGAVNALALVAEHPEDVRVVVAHEPPTAQVLDDREAVLAATEDIQRTYQRGGQGPAMAKFIAIVSHKGPIPAGYADQPGPDPAMFGLPAVDDGSRNDALLGQNIVTCTHYQPDFERLRAASTRIVIAAGTESDGEMAHRGAEGVAGRLGTSPVMFPSGHGGFLGGEYGMTGEPAAFAARLREVLAGGR
jgi:pimeloyl-ACP methyl ester carboxylesterase